MRKGSSRGNPLLKSRRKTRSFLGDFLLRLKFATSHLSLANNNQSKFEPGDFDEIFDQLVKLGHDPPHYFIFGGQAVNIWADVYLGQGHESLLEFQPFTSRDCDVWVDYKAFQQIDSLFDFANIVKSQSPIDGQLAIVTTCDEPILIVDFLSSVYGIRRETIPRLQKRAFDLDGIFVLDPLYLFKAKCNNLANLPQSDRQDEKHVKMLLHIVPAHLEFVLNSLQEGEVSERDVIKEFKLLLEFEKDRSVRLVMKEANLKLADLLPMSSDQSFPKLQQFLKTVESG